MKDSKFLKTSAQAAALTLGLIGCNSASDLGKTATSRQEIVDVEHSTVERQSIGNCWIYAQASWVESITQAANGQELDASQSYWTYWHWFDQVTRSFKPDEIQTGGFQFTAHQIVRDRGLMLEEDFVPEDGDGEMSNRQDFALDEINAALERGDFDGADGQRVREIFDEAWGLSDEVREQLDAAFGADGEGTLRQGASVAGTNIIDPQTVAVRYTERAGGQTEVRDATLVDAILEWETISYPFLESQRRDFLRRVQLALHDRQPVVVTWNVDFNALENTKNGREGSFNMQTLEDAGGPGRQGGHMTVLEDYEAETVEFGVLEAGVTLDPSDPDDARKLEAALADSTSIKLLRTKNSWGAMRPDREFAPGFPGYHDLWMDYMNGPIDWCPDVDDKDDSNCTGEATPLRQVMLPPGY